LTDQLHYSSQGVREQTQELASWALGESPKGRFGTIGTASESDWNESEPRTSFESGPQLEADSGAEEEDFLPTIETVTDPFPRKQPLPNRRLSSAQRKQDFARAARPAIVVDDVEPGEVTETSALLGRSRTRSSMYKQEWDFGWLRYKFGDAVESTWQNVTHPAEWDVKEITHVTIGAISAVMLGLLLNVLDALSYGKRTISRFC
jgi:sulfate permease, SulP family